MQKRQQIKIARGLYKASLKNGMLDSIRAEKVLKEIVKLRPQGLIGILQNYSRLVSQALSWQTVVVESASVSGVHNLEKTLIKSTGAQKVQFKHDPKLVFGARITHGDWIYEDTLASKLQQLKQGGTVV
jgi:F0F1-type ATP synthase delta subunit